MLSILSQDDQSENVAALVPGARRRRVKSRAFLRQENPSETVVGSWCKKEEVCWLTVSWGQAGLCGQGRVAAHLCRTRVLQCCGCPPGS